MSLTRRHARGTNARCPVPTRRPDEESTIRPAHEPQTEAPPLPEAVLLDLADELRRLATGLSRDLRRQAILPGLSSLAAMRPVQEMLMRNLAMRVTNPEPESDSADDPPMPGYL
ncbi:MAG: hypothetical protein ACO3D0_09330 [Ilumatobacteraceae bacterium]